MAARLGRDSSAGLERSCGDWVRSRGPTGGLELLEARFAGRGFSPHRHDTYGIAVTDLGVQTFDYRGNTERSLPGQVTVLHPDELHDGRAGTDGGFGYHIVYISPAVVGEAVRGLTGRATPLPFARQAVMLDPALARAVAEAFSSELDQPLARDSLVARLAAGLLRADASRGMAATRTHVDGRALERARAYLEAQPHSVRSDELERVTDLSRYELARQFRLAYGTSPYRYWLQRRLDLARECLRAGDKLADVALDCGFADQAHFTRTFSASFGLPPGRYAQLHAAGSR